MAETKKKTTTKAAPKKTTTTKKTTAKTTSASAAKKAPAKYEPDYDIPRKRTQQTRRKNSTKKTTAKKQTIKTNYQIKKEKKKIEMLNHVKQILIVIGIFIMLLIVSFREISIMEMFNNKKKM